MTTQFPATQNHPQPLLTLDHREKFTSLFQRQHIQTRKPLKNPAETAALCCLAGCSGHLPWPPWLSQEPQGKSSSLTATTAGIDLPPDFNSFLSYREEIMQGKLRKVKKEVQRGGMSLLEIRSMKLLIWCFFPFLLLPQNFLLISIPRWCLLFPSYFLFVCFVSLEVEIKLCIFS